MATSSIAGLGRLHATTSVAVRVCRSTSCRGTARGGRLACACRERSHNRLSLRLRLPQRVGGDLPCGDEPDRTGSPIVDLSHGVPPLDVRSGAVLLVDSLPYLSAEAILLAIVDPSVGRDRDVAFESNDGRLVVGPDNGLLSPAAAALGGVARAVEITSPDVVLTPISPSFHARDVLAPAAAHLSAGPSSRSSARRSIPPRSRRSGSRADGRAREDRV